MPRVRFNRRPRPIRPDQGWRPPFTEGPMGPDEGWRTPFTEGPMGPDQG
jgi:hypothetical protein